MKQLDLGRIGALTKTRSISPYDLAVNFPTSSQQQLPVGRDWCAFHQSATIKLSFSGEVTNPINIYPSTSSYNLAVNFPTASQQRLPVGRDWCAFHQSADNNPVILINYQPHK
jgi:hypothetical protein